jgi:integrase
MVLHCPYRRKQGIFCDTLADRPPPHQEGLHLAGRRLAWLFCDRPSEAIVGKVTRLPARVETKTLGEAVVAYLATLDHPESAGTKRVYAGTLRALRTTLGAEAAVAELDKPATAKKVTGWFEATWGGKAASTYNRNLNALRSAIGYWIDCGWLVTDPTATLRRRGQTPDRSKALPKERIEEFLAREDLPIRERTLFKMLYETAARASEVLSLDIEDLDRRNKTAPVRRKGGAIDVIAWQTGPRRRRRRQHRPAPGPVRTHLDHLADQVHPAVPAGPGPLPSQPRSRPPAQAPTA